MGRFDRRKVAILVAAVVLVIVAGFLIEWSRTPDPMTSSYQIGASGYVRTQINRQKNPNGRRSSTSFTPPHHVDFASNGGVVEVCVVPCQLGYSMKWSNYIKERTAEFAAGQVPKDTIAQASGVRGRINLSRWSRKESEFSYIVLFRGENGCQVTMVTHYWPW